MCPSVKYFCSLCWCYFLLILGRLITSVMTKQRNSRSASESEHVHIADKYNASAYFVQLVSPACPRHVIVSWQPSTNTVHSTFLAVKFLREKSQTRCLKLFSPRCFWRIHVFQTTNATGVWKYKNCTKNNLFILNEKHLEHFLFFRWSAATPCTGPRHGATPRGLIIICSRHVLSSGSRLITKLLATDDTLAH